MLDVNAAELEHLLARGWRRFGPSYFRPVCSHCAECVGIRVDVSAWQLTRSQKRVLARNRDLTCEFANPSIDAKRLALYTRWHQAREHARGWEAAPLSAHDYATEFAFAHPAARELTIWLGQGSDRELLGVGLFDELPNALSAVYFYYAPEHAERSLGVLNVVSQLQRAQAQMRAHVYLGYRVKDCPSMAYKTRYQPHELLRSSCDLHETPQWILASEWSENSQSVERPR